MWYLYTMGHYGETKMDKQHLCKTIWMMNLISSVEQTQLKQKNTQSMILFIQNLQWPQLIYDVTSQDSGYLGSALEEWREGMWGEFWSAAAVLCITWVVVAFTCPFLAIHQTVQFWFASKDLYACQSNRKGFLEQAQNITCSSLKYRDSWGLLECPGENPKHMHF